MTRTQYDAAPAWLIVREFKAAGKVMVTTLNCPKKYPKEALKSLYQSRWQIELDIRNIKDTLQMNILSCKAPEMVRKEIWVYLLAYNLILLLMAQSALLADINPRSISFKHSLQLWSMTLQLPLILDDEMLETLFNMMAEKRIGNRAGRIEPRAVKRRPKAYPLLMQSRNEARNKMKKYGHPKKLK